MHMAGNLLQRIKQVFCGKPKAATCWCQCEAKSSHASDDELRKIVKEKRLNHITILPDGDRRWARERGLSPSDGHKRMAEIIPVLFEEVWRLGIHTGTTCLFSTENWKREPTEKELLLSYIADCIRLFLPVAHKYKVRIVHIGRKDRLPGYLLEAINNAEKITSNYSEHIFNLGIDYGARDEIVRAFRKIIDSGTVSSSAINENIIAEALDMGNQPYPDPDFVVRAGKVQRLSGFGAWQSTYTELHFPTKYFPDFDVNFLRDLIIEYGKRKRTFGGNV
jgi:undecaprenyl diphosphate synthase